MYTLRITFPTTTKAAEMMCALNNQPKFRFSRMLLREKYCAVDIITVCTSQKTALDQFANEHGGTTRSLTPKEVREQYCWLCQALLEVEGADKCTECFTTQYSDTEY